MKSVLLVLAALVAVSCANPIIEIEKNNLFTIVTLGNSGAYVARLGLTYILNGELKSQQSSRIPVGQKQSLFIEPGATAVLVQGEVDIFINNWSVIFTQNFPVAETACFKVWGTTLNTSWDQVGC